MPLARLTPSSFPDLSIDYRLRTKYLSFMSLQCANIKCLVIQEDDGDLKITPSSPKIDKKIVYLFSIARKRQNTSFFWWVLIVIFWYFFTCYEKIHEV